VFNIQSVEFTRLSKFRVDVNCQSLRVGVDGATPYSTFMALAFDAGSTVGGFLIPLWFVTDWTIWTLFPLTNLKLSRKRFTIEFDAICQNIRKLLSWEEDKFCILTTKSVWTHFTFFPSAKKHRVMTISRTIRSILW